jgi:hypothetical protein
MADLISMLAAASGGAVAESDPNFKQTVLLLHGDGTNGAQNNTFLDGSTNNFTITRNGNTTQGTFSPFSGSNGYWSNYLDGNDWIQVADNSALELGSGDFTIEAWVYFNTGNLGGANTGISLVSKWNASNYSYLAGFFNDGGTWKLNFAYSTNGSATTNIRVTAGLAANVWYHVAYVRSGSSLKMFLDGVEKTTTETISGTLFDGNEPVAIGRTGDGFNYVTGYMSNVRIVKGTAVYTSAFTPPTAPLTAITNTSLLTCQSNRFVDNSTNAFAITRNGDVRVTPFSPFAPTAAYSASTNGGSGYFDGTGDWLTPPDDAALDLDTGDFTLEFWIYRLNSSRKEVWVTMRGFTVYFDSGSFIWTGSGALTLATVNINSWNHIEVVKSGATVYSFVNGVVTNHGSQTMSSNQAPQIGAEAGASPFTGYIAGLRVLKGTALHTTSFTPPTAPPTVITNTSLLCNFTNAGIFDNTGKNNLETVGNAQIDTTTKKYGTGSMEFDGTGDFLKVRKTAEFEFGSGNFTVEFWANANALSGAYTGVVGVWVGGSSVTANAWNITLNAFNGTNKFGFSYSNGSVGTDVIFNATTSTGSWDHYAVVRSGSTLYGFKNGVSQAISSGSSTITATITPGTVDLYIGTVGTASSGTDFNGYIDDLRVTKGVARYTANFTAPTKAFPDQ